VVFTITIVLLRREIQKYLRRKPQKEPAAVPQ